MVNEMYARVAALGRLLAWPATSPRRGGEKKGCAEKNSLEENNAN